MSTITINDKEYKLEDLSDNARAQLNSIQVANQRIAQLQSELALAQTARNAYSIALNSQLPKKEASAKKKNGVVSIDDKRYSAEDFSENAKMEITNLQVTDNMIVRLQAEVAIAGTAKNAYTQALAALVAEENK